MKQINGIKIGKTVNVSINGKLFKKICETEEVANKFYKTILDVSKNPTDEGIKNIQKFLSEKTRIALECGLETDPDTGEVYLAGFNTPVPMDLVEVIKEYHENGYPLDAIINFWKLLMLNPDKRVRTTLFDFIKTHDFVLTDNGYMIVYKAVAQNSDHIKNKKLAEFISNRYLHVKKEWSTSPFKYLVYRDTVTGELHITKTKTAETWDLETKNVEIIGNLKELYNNLDKLISDTEDSPYTDKYTQSMKIKLGVPVKMERTECNSDPLTQCSYGLHVGATSYVEEFANSDDTILACYVNPANVVAVPKYNNSKMRVSEYFPFAVMSLVDDRIDIIEQKYLPSDYTEYEKEELEKMIENVQKNELPIEKSIGCGEETRSLEEMKKIIENRLVSIVE